MDDDLSWMKTKTTKSYRRYSSPIMNDKNEPVTLAFFPQELHAQMLADALQDEGIESEVSGGVTGGFRAEAPGMVKVLVRATDLARAKAIFQDWEHQGESVDWDEVDVGEMEDDVEP